MGRRGDSSTRAINLGSSSAERDHLLEESFFASADFSTVVAPDDFHCFLVGRTGSGKSAILLQIGREFPRHSVRIEPRAASLAYVFDLGVVKRLIQNGDDLELFLSALWKHIFVVEIIKLAYGTDRNIIDSLLRAITPSDNRDQTNRYVEKFKNIFFAERHDQLRVLAQSIEEDYKTGTDLEIKLPPSQLKSRSSDSVKSKAEERSESRELLERTINEGQLFRLNDIVDFIRKDRTAKQVPILYVLIDNADWQWRDDTVSTAMIRALIAAIIELGSLPRIRILAAFRPSVFDFVAVGEHQEKTRDLSYRMSWSREDIKELLDRRLNVASQRSQISPVPGLLELLPVAASGRISALDYLLSRTMMRPRDAILFLVACLRQSRGKYPLTWDQMRAAEGSYSRERLQAVSEEWEVPYPGLLTVLQQFRGQSPRLPLGALQTLVERVCLLCGDSQFANHPWLSTRCEALLSFRARHRTWEANYGKIVNLLYEICFLGIVNGRRREPLFSFDDDAPVAITETIAQTSEFTIHPAFWSALEISLPLGRKAKTP
jgi:hypothetical protein